jgi:hypothetical protein
MPKTCSDHRQILPLPKKSGNPPSINPNSRQILDVKRDQRTSKSVSHVAHFGGRELVLELARESVRFPLELPAYSVHADTYDSLKGCQDHLCSESQMT